IRAEQGDQDPQLVERIDQRAAQAAQAAGARWIPGALAIEADDRKRPPDPAPSAFDDAATDPWPGHSPSDPLSGVSAADKNTNATLTLESVETLSAPPAPAPLDRPRLGLTRADNSTVVRYAVAAQRVDAAYESLERRLRSELNALWQRTARSTRRAK